MRISLGEAIIKARIWIVVVTLTITAVLGYFLKDLEVDPDVFNYLPEDDPKAALFREVGLKYGGNYMGIIGLETKNIFTTQTLMHIRDLTDSVRYTDGVGTVTSLTNVIDIKSTEWGIEIGKLIDEYDIPETEAELQVLKQYTLSDEMYRGTLVSEDATFTAIMLRINEGMDKIAVAREVKRKVESMGLPEKLYFGGMPFAIQSLGEIIMGDLLFLAPVTALVIILLLFIGFRSWRGIILPLLTVGISIVWTIGLMGLFRIEITIISDVIPVILLAVGSAYTIHVVNRINGSAGNSLREKIATAIGYIWVPVFLAAITTMAGFISFIFGSYLTMISSFGIFMAAGVAFSLILSLTFAPALLAMFDKTGNRPVKRTHTFLQKPLLSLSRSVIRHPGRTASLWGLILLIGLAGLFLIERKVDVNDYFKRSDPTHISEKIFREKFGGSMPVYVVVKGDMQSPAVLTSMKEITSRMKQSDAIVHAQSVVDLIEKMNEVMKDGKRVPDSKLKVQQLWLLLEGQEVMEQLVNYEKTEGMINATFNKGDVDAMKSFTDDFQQYIDEKNRQENQATEKNAGEGSPVGVSADTNAVSVEFTGLPSLYLNIDRSLINSQFQSLVYALALVLLMVALMLRSIRLGGYTLIPILATLIVLFGFMGLVRIPLDVATVLVGSVSIGIGIDYAIHMVSHFHHEKQKGTSNGEAIQDAIHVSGRAITINVLSVALGFLVLVFSNLVPIQRFGLLVAVTMFTSGMASLTLLPAMLLIGEKINTSFKKKHLQNK